MTDPRRHIVFAPSNRALSRAALVASAKAARVELQRAVRPLEKLQIAYAPERSS